MPPAAAFLNLIGAGIALAGAGGTRADDDKVLTEEQVLRDPGFPVIGNAQGRHHHRRMVRLQLPVLPQARAGAPPGGAGRRQGPPGAEGLADPRAGLQVAARMALAAKYQDKFEAAHEAMISVNSRITEPRITELLSGAGLDIDQLKKDLDANAKAIDALLSAQQPSRRWRSASAARRHSSSASTRVPGVLSIDQFEQVIAATPARPIWAARPSRTKRLRVLSRRSPCA